MSTQNIERLTELAADKGYEMTVTANEEANFCKTTNEFSFKVKVRPNESIASAVRQFAEEEFNIDAYAKARMQAKFGNDISAVPSITAFVGEALSVKEDIIALADELAAPELEAYAAKWLSDNYHYIESPKGSGHYQTGVYIAQGDESLHGMQITPILYEDKDAPGSTTSMPAKFWGALEDIWGESRILELDETANRLISAAEKDGVISDGSDGSQRMKDILWDYLMEHFDVGLPSEFCLKGDAYVAILIDTGDANCDWTLNTCHAPHRDDDGDDWDERAGLVWLAHQQGYDTASLEIATRADVDEEDTETFLGSVNNVLYNCSASCGALAFYVRMSFAQAMQLEAMRRLGVGSITLSKDTKADIFDFWNSGGSCGETFVFEKDVVIPANIIYSVRPDTQGYRERQSRDGKWEFGCDVYDPSSVYGEYPTERYKETVLGMEIPEDMKEKVLEMVV